MHIPFRKLLLTGLLFVIMMSMMAGCNLPISVNPATTNIPESTSKNAIESLVTFKANLESPLPPGESLYINILDEVTGLPNNDNKYIMTAESASSYSISLPLDLDSVIMYRYTREGSIVVNEAAGSGYPVRYRMFHVEGQATVEDIINRWSDNEALGASGQIAGKLTDTITAKPIPNILIAVGGDQTLSTTDGTFIIEKLRPGTHNMVLYAPDGTYKIFQQGVVIAADSTTPVIVQLTPVAQVTVIFTVKVPKDTPPDAVVRLAGNLTQLGNTVMYSPGGDNISASKMPVLGKLPDGRWILTINLPVGAYIEYKYTLGDGLKGIEVSADGSFHVRNLIVPENENTINDVVESWQSESTTPIQ